jgi:NAD(P) transhydrogenase subunit alpha
LTNSTILGAYVFLLAIIIGFEIIARVPSMLHTPLMSGTNAIHGVVLVGAIVVAAQANTVPTDILGFIAVVLGSLNVFGGFVVTDRMLQMFKPRKEMQR